MSSNKFFETSPVNFLLFREHFLCFIWLPIPSNYINPPINAIILYQKAKRMRFTWAQSKKEKFFWKLMTFFNPGEGILSLLERKIKFSNCLSHQNHFNEHDMHNNRSFHIIIIFCFRFRLQTCLDKYMKKFSSSFLVLLKSSDDSEKGFSRFSRNGIWIRISSSSWNPPMLYDNLWYINVERSSMRA